MPRRRRWTPVRGTATRIADPAERAAILAFDAAGRLARPIVFSSARAPAIDPAALREILVLRLDRIGDVIMSLPALLDLREGCPLARIRLAVGAWSEPIARRAPVDEVLVWSAPWVGRRVEGAHAMTELGRRARALRGRAPDLALDLQGDVRGNILMALSGARARVGYANTGGAWLLTHVVELDESVSFLEQNRRAVDRVTGGRRAGGTTALLTAEDRATAERRLVDAGLARRPRVGVHPSGGRGIKQWDLARWGEVARRLQRDLGAVIVITGSAADAELGRTLAAAVPGALDLTGRLSLMETLGVIGALDLFLSPDTGTMHMACAVGTPSVSVFGPSDPGRYFSGGSGESGTRHVVVRASLWCAPCNLIRRPPEECTGDEGPECLRLVDVDAVHAAAARLLS